MESDLLPTEEEFEILTQAIGEYSLRISQIVANEEVLKATSRLADRASKAMSENEKAFDAAFDPKQPSDFVADLAKEIDKQAILAKVKEEADKLVLLSAKMIRLRDKVRSLGTEDAIRQLLKS